MNTILIKMTEAKEYLDREGWRLIENSLDTYAEFIEAVKNLDDESYIMDFHVKHLFVFPSSSRRYKKLARMNVPIQKTNFCRYWATNEMVHAGKFLLQDKASCLPTFLLNPPHKSTVLDMCSAPVC